MIKGEFWELHDEPTLRRIDAAAVRLLTKGGCRIEHEGLLRRLEGAGCRLDLSARRCYFPEGLIREAIEHLGGRTAERIEIPGDWSPRLQLEHSGNYPHLLEWPSGVRRLATPEDVADMARLGHSLDEFVTVGKVLTCSHIDQRVEPLWSALLLAKITDKPISGGEIFYADTIEPLVRMGEVLTGRAGETCLVSDCDFFIPPLILEGKQAECMLEKRRFGLRNVPGTMPVSGISTPVTIAGTVAVAVAELMAGWVIGYVVAPELPAGGIVSSGSLDLRTMAACFNSPEALLQDAATVQVCRRLYGIPVRAATGYVDCKRPGLEAAFQKMFPLVATRLWPSHHPGAGGLLSAGLDYSPVQHLLDAEMAQAVDRFWGGFEVNEETLALDLTESIMAAQHTNFLDTDHTLSHYQAEQWYPRWLDRRLWQGREVEVEAERKMLERIDRYCKEAIARYEPPELDRDKLAELERIFRAYERRILGANLTPVQV